MEDVRRTDELEKLMSELAWLKRLATALVRDESDANDLVQDTWLVAAEHAPTDGRPLKPWLSRVALNLVRMRSRSTKRRVARETAVEPAAESSPTPDELVGRVRAQRVVADEVLRLAEPYRNTVLLHYFEDLSSAEIARRSGVPEGTVRRRLKVALDELRGRLHAEERKTGQAIVAALAPFAVKQSAATAALGVVVVKKVIAVAIVVVGLVLLGTQLYKNRTRTTGPVAAAEPAGAAAVRPRAAPSGAPAHITVVVTDGAGPVANAAVRCAPADGEIVVAKTGSDGNASLDLAAGPWSIAASADGHEPAAATLAVAAGRDDRVRLVLASGGQTLTGIVTDMTGGVIAGARIDAARLGVNAKPGSAVAMAVSDRDGRYKLAVGAGEVLVAASHPEYAPQTRYVDLGSGGATADFALVPGGGIEGIVRDAETKQPVAGAEVHATRDLAGLELADVNERVARADHDGVFRFAGLSPGGYELVAHDGTRSSRAPVGVGVGVAEQQTNIVVLVGATATIRGKVVDDNGAPVSNVTVNASGAGAAGMATSDAAGAFLFEGLAPGRWALRGTGASHLPDGLAIVQLAKSDVDGVVVRVRRGLEVKGHVEPREVCDVELAKSERADFVPRHESMTTNADGEFHFSPYGPGPATIVARCPNGDEGSAAVAAGAGDSAVPVAPGGAIEGRVVDAAGKPVAGVTVSAASGDATTRIVDGAVASGFKAITSKTGEFDLASLGAADYRLSVLDTGHPMKLKKPVALALAAGQHATGVELVVERPDGTIQGTVTGPDDAPIADAWVALHQSVQDQVAGANDDDSPGPHRLWVTSDGGGAREPPPAMTDAHGHFALTGLPRGRYQVVAEAQAGKLRGGAADVTTDAQITIKLASVSSLRGTVHGPGGPTELFTVRLTGPIVDGRPGSGAAFAFPPPTGPNVQARSFTDGAFVFPRLDPGTYSIEVESTDGVGKASVQVSPEDGTSVDIALVANGTVTGRVVDKAGKPLSGMGVVLQADQKPPQLQISIEEQPPTSGPDGRFQVQGAPGMRMLVVLGHTPTAKRGLSIAAGTTIDVGDVTVDDTAK